MGKQDKQDKQDKAKKAKAKPSRPMRLGPVGDNVEVKFPNYAQRRFFQRLNADLTLEQVREFIRKPNHKKKDAKDPESADFRRWFRFLDRNGDYRTARVALIVEEEQTANAPGVLRVVTMCVESERKS